jgi:FkbM family methyltransferase
MIYDKIIERYLTKSPVALADIGASGGLKKNWKLIRQYLHLIGFEPDQRSFESLVQECGDDNVTYLNTALYSEKKQIEFYLTDKPQLSSIFKPNMELVNRFSDAERFYIKERKEIAADTLDNQLEENGISGIDFIKLDTQGSELDILKGGERILTNSVFGLEIEVEFSELYLNQPIFPDIHKYVSQMGFQLFDLHPCYWKRNIRDGYRDTTGQLIFGDAIYLKDINSLRQNVEKLTDDIWEQKAKLIRALAICTIYRHFDYAVEIIDTFKHLFSEEENDALIKTMKGEPSFLNRIRKIIPNFRSRGVLSQAVFNLWKILQPGYWKCYLHLLDGQRIEKY